MIYRFLPDVDKWASVQVPKNLRVEINDFFETANTKHWRKPSFVPDHSMGLLPDLIGVNTDAPLFSTRAWRIISDFFPSETAYEADVKGAAESYWFLPLKILDLVDPEKAELREIVPGVMTVERYAFRPEVAAAPPLFRVPETQWRHMLATEEFVNFIERSELTGGGFKPVIMAETKA